MQSYVARLGISSLLVFVAFGVASMEWPYVRPTSLGLFYVAVAIASWFLGRVAGLFATALSVLLITYNFAAPLHSLRVDRAGMIFLVEFTLIALVFSYASSSRRQALELANQETARLRLAESELRSNEARWRILAESVPNLIWTCRADGSMDYVSPQWSSYTGETQSKQMGFQWLQLIHPEDRDRVCIKWETATKSRSAFEATCRIKSATAAYHWFKMRAVPVLDGEQTHWVGTCTDVDDLDTVDRGFHEPVRCTS